MTLFYFVLRILAITWLGLLTVGCAAAAANLTGVEGIMAAVAAVMFVWLAASAVRPTASWACNL